MYRAGAVVSPAADAKRSGAATPAPAYPTGVVFTLEPGLCVVAQAIGLLRQASAIGDMRRNAFDGDDVGSHCLGAHGELAGSIAGRIFYHPRVGRIDCRDLGRLEVRTRPPKAPPPLDHLWNDLPIEPKDPDDAPVVLVYGPPPHMTFVGWIVAEEGRRVATVARFIYGRRVRFVPPQKLHRFDPATLGATLRRLAGEA